MGAHQRERELACQKLVIGKARPRLALGRDVGGLGRPMQRRERAGEIRPVRARHKSVVEPLRERRQPAECRRDVPAQHVRGEPLGQRIDWLDERHRSEPRLVDHAVGMHHLQHAVIECRGARHIAAAADRQQFLDHLAWRGEIGDGQRAGVVARIDDIGRARAVRRRRAMRIDMDRDGHDRTGHDFRKLRPRAAVDRAGRQMQHEIDHTCHVVAAGEPAIKLLHLVGDARQRRHRREQGVEEGRAHTAILRRAQ